MSFSFYPKILFLGKVAQGSNKTQWKQRLSEATWLVLSETRKWALHCSQTKLCIDLSLFWCNKGDWINSSRYKVHRACVLLIYKPLSCIWVTVIWLFALITSCSACRRSSQKLSRCQSACIYTMLCFVMSYLCATAASHDSWADENHKHTDSAKSGSWQRALSVSCSNLGRLESKSCTLVINRYKCP